MSVLSVTFVYCGQTVGWIKMSLGMEVGLGPGDIVLDGDPAPQNGGTAAPPLFGSCLLLPNGWMDQDATWYGGRRNVLIWGETSMGRTVRGAKGPDTL